VDSAQEIGKAKDFIAFIQKEISKYVIGQDEVVKQFLLAMISNGHVLVEGVPGLAKTTIVKSIANVISAKFSRVQFTPDLLPSDIVGTVFYNPTTSQFSIHQGPVFTNILLADEINRAPSKVQSALLESMQERQVTIGDSTLKLPDQFWVFATQNPIEQEGTYNLPEAQIDRFLLKCVIGYPSIEDEKKIIELLELPAPKNITPQVTLEDFTTLSTLAQKVFLEDSLRDYIVNIVSATRDPKTYGIKGYETTVDYGASPRACIALMQCSKALALSEGRDHVIPEDIKYLALPTLRHRIILSYQAQAEGIKTEELIQQIINTIHVP
jgi:MoxR-like ATPase